MEHKGRQSKKWAAILQSSSSLDETLPNTKSSIRFACCAIWGPKNADVPGLQNQPHEMAFRHCLSTFVPYPLTAQRREGEIVDGLIAGQKRQWSGGDWRLERKGRSKELEMRTAAGTTTGSDGMTKVK